MSVEEKMMQRIWSEGIQGWEREVRESACSGPRCISRVAIQYRHCDWPISAQGLGFIWPPTTIQVKVTSMKSLVVFQIPGRRNSIAKVGYHNAAHKTAAQIV